MLPGSAHVTDRLSSWPAWRWALVLLGLALLLRLPIFFYPFFNGDEATYSALAHALLDGRWLYVGAVDHKPPLIAATYALLYAALPSFCIHGIHLASILVVAATGLLLGAAAHRLGADRKSARLSGLVYLLFASLGPGKDMLAANAELFMLLPTCGSVLLFALSRRGGAQAAGDVALLVGAGMLGGLAFLYKYQGGAILGTLVFFTLLDSRHRLLQRLARMVPLGLGFLAVPGGLILLYLAAGHLDELHFWAWTYPLRYAGKLAPGEIAGNALKMTLFWAVPAAALLVAAVRGAGQLRRGSETDRALLRLALLWLLWGLSGVAAGGRFFLHYYLQLAPPLALLGAPFLVRIWPQRTPRRLVLAALVIPLLAFWVAGALDHTLRPRIPRYTRVYQEVGQWVQQHSSPEERLLVWGNSPEIYHFARRRMGTRFPFCNYHSGKIWGTAYDAEGATGTEGQQVGEAWPLLLQDLRERRPELIVDAAAGGLDRWRGHELERYPRLWEILTRDYRLAGEVAGVKIYRLLNTQTGAP